jgi:hypothetical protein
MASILTGLAFMHGHIVDRELVLRLGRDDSQRYRGAAMPAPAPPIRRGKAVPSAGRTVSPSDPACTTC